MFIIPTLVALGNSHGTLHTKIGYGHLPDSLPTISLSFSKTPFPDDTCLMHLDPKMFRESLIRVAPTIIDYQIEFHKNFERAASCQDMS